MLLPVIPNDSAFSKGSCRPNSSLLRYNQLSVIQEERVHGGFFIDIGLADLKRANPEIVLLVLNLQILFLTSMVIIMATLHLHLMLMHMILCLHDLLFYVMCCHCSR